jgi:putative Mg2+ transporter-C (MgtC) family protein
MSSIHFADTLLRLALAFAAGFIVGWERESHGRPAGLRTNILVCVASAVAMIASELIFVQSANSTPSGSVRADPARLAAGILTGIGFLGAGTILRHDNFVRGVTTAATLWFLAILGLAFGAGDFKLGICGLVLALIALHGLSTLEKKIEGDWYAVLTVTAPLDSLSDQQLRERVEALGPKVLSLKVSCDFANRFRTVTCELKLKRSRQFELPGAVVANLATCPGILSVRWG